MAVSTRRISQASWNLLGGSSYPRESGQVGKGSGVLALEPATSSINSYCPKSQGKPRVMGCRRSLLPDGSNCKVVFKRASSGRGTHVAIFANNLPWPMPFGIF